MHNGHVHKVAVESAVKANGLVARPFTNNLTERLQCFAKVETSYVT